MRIVVVGAGEVGYYITRLLTDPKHQTQNMEVAIIDADAERVSELAAQLDATMVEGSGSHPESLQLAGIDKADLLVAVSSSDEVNLIAGQYAKIQGVK
ncbi:MAG TPA: NAD-binding protein, partial [Acidimicrobiales bacterium]|nr:NAD-binding protein [Acidimicrobiales bacterium]